MNAFAILAVSLITLGIVRAHAQDASVTITRGRRLTQTSEATLTLPADNTAFFFRAEALGISFFEPIQNAQVLDPNKSSQVLKKSGDDAYRFEQGFTTEAILQKAFPIGRYTFSATLNLIGPVAAHADLDATPFPPVPTLQSFAETQSIDVHQEFTLRWKPFTDIADDDQLSLRVVDPSSGTVVEEADSLEPATTEWTFSADTLPGDKQLAGELIYRRLAIQSEPGLGELLPGTSFSVSETHFTLVTRGSITPTDTTPPSLVSTTPANGSSLDTVFTPILFTFSEPMDRSSGQVVIEATLNNQPVAIDPSMLTQFWSEDARSLICTYNQLGGGWPAGVTLIWRLNPNPNAAPRFQDPAGNPLPTYTGQFLAAGGTDPCTSEAPGAVPGSSFAFFKQVNYRQTSSDAPATDAVLGSQAFGFISLPSSTSVQTIVTLKVPTANPNAFLLKVLTPPAGAPSLRFRIFSETFAARSDLDTAYPAGTYRFELRDSQAQVTNSVPLNVSATGYPPIPHIANYPECQQINPESAFIVRWDPFTGATTNGEFVSLQIVDSDENTVFQAPDPCHQISLKPADSQVQIPTGTLAKGKSYTGILTFTRMTDTGKTLPSIPGSGVVTLGRIVRFSIGTGTLTPPQAPVLQQMRLITEGTLEVTVRCTPGRPLTLDRSVTLGSSALFSTLTSTNPPTDTVTFLVPTVDSTGFLRATHP